MGESEREPTPVQPIDYRTAPPGDARRSRAVVIALLIIGAGFGGVMLLLLLARVRTMPRAVAVAVATPAPVPAAAAAPVDYEQVRRKEAYAAYLAHAARPGHVVYDEDPVAAGKLVAAQPREHRAVSYNGIEAPWAGAFQRPVVEFEPAGVGRVQPFMDNGTTDRSVLFVGRLTSPAGNARLVFLDMDVKLSGGRTANRSRGDAGAPTPGSSATEYVVTIQRKLGYRIYDATAIAGFPNQFREGTSLTVTTPTDKIPIRWIDGSLRADQSAGGIRFYAGMLDPQDRSHCTIDYDYGGQRGTIDVFLTDDDFLRVLPRIGRTTGGTWEISAGVGGGQTVEKSSTHPPR